jgi:hypothetical protein
VLAFAGVSAWLAAIEGHTVGGAVGALALGILPIVAVVMLDLAVASIRRADLRAAGLLPGRAPVYSALGWVLAAASTAKAWHHWALWENPDGSCLAATTPPDRLTGTPLAFRIDPDPDEDRWVQPSTRIPPASDGARGTARHPAADSATGRRASATPMASSLIGAAENRDGRPGARRTWLEKHTGIGWGRSREERPRERGRIAVVSVNGCRRARAAPAAAATSPCARSIGASGPSQQLTHATPEWCHRPRSWRRRSASPPCGSSSRLN